jgi:hypothetical protein
MWELKNRTPYAAERTWVQDKDGRKHWVVAVRGAFQIGPDGALSLADEQPPPEMAPVYRGEDGKTSLRYEADLVALKPGTDVYLNASAHAPGGRPTTKTSVSLRVGDRVKTLDVVGEHVFEREITGQVVPSAPMPFVSLPLEYERAYGGYDASDPDPSRHELFAPNPVGTGVATSRAALLGRPAPSISVGGGGDRKAAAGFGAICSYWHPRITFGGTYDGAWVERRKPLLPQDWDPRFLMCAPPDQQFLPHLRGGEPVELRGMTPSGLLRLAIPKVYLGFTTRVLGRDHYHRGWLVSVVIEPDHPRLLATWQTWLPCHRDMDYLDYTVIREKPYLT